MWPTLETVAERWDWARLRMLLYRTYGHPSIRRRARILAARQLQLLAE
ncbi:hypothetical protein GPX89_07580 [Nocardia sp. ET3-3]|uniref:Uncharacterized protein n=1 Tax=Nocardia terrae TaxID=2675851 RepID=A0A7K1US06_9NOCA|nr:hypothetical protein [Nocardia terrae]MVU77107.1 hypothetical protein [Nocardia terrae]